MAIKFRVPWETVTNEIDPNEDVKKRKAKVILKEKVRDQLFRANQQINHWRDALQMAEDVITPDRTELMRIFQDVVLDDHLSGVMEQRILKAISDKWYIYKESGEVDEELTEIMEEAWFEDFMRLVMESIFYGYSLIQLGDQHGSGFKEVTAVRREYVDPVRRGVKPQLYTTDASSLTYFDKEPFWTWTIFVGRHGDLGLLNKSTPLIIWKKNALQFWSQFGELFGVPWRVGKTDVDDNVRRENLYKMLGDMGNAPYAVIDQDDDLDLVESHKTDAYEVFDKMAERSDKGNSKLILGQTMTMEDGSSRSQAEVHERVSEKYTHNDKKLISRVVNNELLPRMVKLGMIPSGSYFGWDQEESLQFEERLKGIEILRRAGYKIGPDKIEELTGIPVEEPDNPPAKGIKESLEEVNNIYAEFYKRHNHKKP